MTTPPELPRPPAAAPSFLRDPAAWDRACAQDPVRNEIVLPHLARILKDSGLRQVLDIGSGTGYLTRRLSAEPWASEIRWTLVDVRPELLDFAMASVPSGIEAARLEFDLVDTQADVPTERKGDFGFLAFTALEMPFSAAVARNLLNLLVPGGELTIYLPDALADVMTAVTLAKDPEPLAEYVAGHTSLEKTDHFTRTPYAFHANRLEFVIHLMLAAGFSLEALDMPVRPERPSERIFCLRFRRR